jgi:putative flippase GtrA
MPAMALVSILGNLLLMRFLVGALGIDYLVANLTAVATCSLVNFALGDCFVFRTQTTLNGR